MRLLVSLIGACAIHAGAIAACPPQDTLASLRATKWEVADHARRQSLAIDMLDCLRDPNPALRDEAGFESLQTWMRAQKLDPATMQTINATLQARLSAADATGFAQPFAALVLADVVRADRIKPWLSDAERAALVRATTTYLAGVRDYRGYDEKDGWRHGVAHGADVMMQMALHPALGKADQLAILAAIRTQLTSPGMQTPAHFYRYGEGERLMAPVFYLARGTLIGAADWEAWFASLVPAKATQPQTALAHAHNLKSFLHPLYVYLAESKDEAQRARVLPFVTKALKQLD